MTKGQIAICVLVVLITAVLINILVPQISTGTRLERAAVTAKVDDVDDGTCFEDITDWWGNEVCISRVNDREKNVVIYTAISAGRDGEFGTDDDLSKVRRDYNKSKIIGKWAGKKFKQGVLGWYEGLKEKSKHDK